MKNIHGFEQKNGQLYIGNHTVSSLAQRYKTPLYVMDEARIRSQMQLFKEHFKLDGLTTHVLYASKAFLTTAMVQVVESEGLGLDVVSGGELMTAVAAKFPLSKVYFHGNNKSKDEMRLALDHEVGTIILDNDAELNQWLSLLDTNQTLNVMLRVNPGIEAHTHAYIATSTLDSKFGLSLSDSSTLSLIQRLQTLAQVHFRGLHCHIGSQILETDAYFKEVDVLLRYIKAHQLDVPCLNLGGGFGVRYTSQDTPIDLVSFLPSLLRHMKKSCLDYALSIPELFIEPGRSIVAEAGLTVYEVGTTKLTPSGKHYCFVDGSMADAIRTALYQADYDACLVDRVDEVSNTRYTIAGKACESGDILIQEISLPQVNTGDYLAVYSTGAYHYSMASHYNRLPNPAVVFVHHDEVKVVVEKERYEDLLKLDRKI